MHGTPTSDPKPGERVKNVSFSADALIVDLIDGRTISVPLAWYPRLLHATARQRSKWQLSGGGYGIHWPDIDEDLSTDGLLAGAPAPRGSLQMRLRPPRKQKASKLSRSENGRQVARKKSTRRTKARSASRQRMKT